MAKHLFERPNFTDIDSARDYLWRLVEELEHLPSDRSTVTNNASYTTINEVNLTDEIVEMGTSGNWTYRKWSSGISECWGTVSGTIGNVSAWGHNSINASDDAYGAAYITDLFTSAPEVQATADKNDGASILLATVAQGTESNTPTYKVLGLSNQTLTGESFKLHIYALGRWK